MIQATATGTRVTMSVTAGLIIASNPTSGGIMVKLMQYFEILRYINVENIPDIFLSFLDIFSSNFYDFSPNPFKFDETDPVKAERLKDYLELLDKQN